MTTKLENSYSSSRKISQLVYKVLLINVYHDTFQFRLLLKIIFTLRSGQRAANTLTYGLRAVNEIAFVMAFYRTGKVKLSTGNARVGDNNVLFNDNCSGSRFR